MRNTFLYILVRLDSLLNVSLGRRSFVMIVSGTCLCIASFFGLYIFHSKSVYFSDPGPYSRVWAGYTPTGFAGLFFFTICPIPGAVLLFNGLRGLNYVIVQRYFSCTPLANDGDVGYSLRTRFCNLLFKSSATLLSAMLFMIVGLVGYQWAKELLQCGYIFCLYDNGVAKEVPNVRPEAGIGWQIMVGTMFVFTSIPISIALFASVIAAFVRISISSRKESTTFPENTPLLEMEIPRRRSKSNPSIQFYPSRFYIFVMVALVLVIGFMFFVSGVLPNNFEYWSAPRVANFAANVVSPRTECKMGACPELPGAFFVSSYIEISKGNLVLKLFPSNLFFYCYLLTILVLGTAIRQVQHGRLLMKKRIPMRPLSNFTVGDVSILIPTVVAALLFFLYWIQSHNFNGLWNPELGKHLGITTSERAARAFGQLSVFFLSLLLFPASRNSVMHGLFGTSWESFLWLHKVLGYSMLAATVAHVISWWVRYGEEGLFPHDIFSVPMADPESIDNFTVPQIFFPTIFIFIAMGILSLPWFRRRFFDLFYYSHMIAAYAMIPTVLYHAQGGWEYMLPGLTVWLFDKLVRLFRSASPVTIVSVNVSGQSHECEGSEGGVVEIKFKTNGISSITAGQYIFLNVPGVSLMEWHPFTISSCEESQNNEEQNTEKGAILSVHIRTMGKGTWTSRLFDHAQKAVSKARVASGVSPLDRSSISGSCQGEKYRESSLEDRYDTEYRRNNPEYIIELQRRMQISVDGPYGTPITVGDYSHVMFVCGGIGVTPSVAMLGAIRKFRVDNDNIFRDRSVDVPSVSLLWVVRQPYLIDILRYALAYPQGHRSASNNIFVRGEINNNNIGGNVSNEIFQQSGNVCDMLKVFLTNIGAAEALPEPPDGFSIYRGRPDVLAEATHIAVMHGLLSRPEKMLLFACGPTPLVDVAKIASLRLGTHFHSETFEL